MIFDLFIQVSFLFVFCLVLAALETQIEGAAGWAQNLPTWRPTPTHWVARFYRKIAGERELTLYHVFVFTLVLVFLHYPYFAGKDWSFASELATISFLFLVAVVWDFLWFVVNPRYDFGEFWGGRVLWHKKWFLHLPVDYWSFFLFSALCYVRFSWNWILFKEWLEIIALFFILTLVVIFFAMAFGLLKPGKEFRRK